MISESEKEAARKKVLLAVEPVIGSEEVREEIMASLSLLLQRDSSELELVAVLSPRTIPATVRTVPESADFYSRAAEHLLDSWMPLCPTGIPVAVKILNVEIQSREEEARVFAEYAKQAGASLIVVTPSHRGKADRFFAGSFTEALVARVDCPVLVMSQGHLKLDQRPILFATDLSEASEAEFLEILALARRSHCPLTLYHHVEVPRRERLMPALLVAPEIEWEAHVKAQMARRWALKAKAQGVVCDYFIDKVSRDPASGLLRIAESKQASFIALDRSRSQRNQRGIRRTFHRLVSRGSRPIFVGNT